MEFLMRRNNVTSITDHPRFRLSFDNPASQRHNRLKDQWENYRRFADDGHGNDCETGKPLKTFDEWLNS
jgi:hypothetical protein